MKHPIRTPLLIGLGIIFAAVIALAVRLAKKPSLIMPRYHSRAERAADLLQSRRSTVESVAKQTGLPVDIVRQINEPIAKRLAEQDAVDAAERSMRKAEAKIMREQYPCPLCCLSILIQTCSFAVFDGRFLFHRVPSPAGWLRRWLRGCHPPQA